MLTRSILYRGEFHALDMAVETWKAEHDEAVRVTEIEELVQNSVRLSRTLDHFQAEMWERLFENKLPHPGPAGDILFGLFQLALTVLPKIGEGIGWAEGRGYRVAGVEALEEAVQKLRRSKEKIERKWPRTDPQEVQRSREDIRQGRYRMAEDIFRDLSGSGAAGDRK